VFDTPKQRLVSRQQSGAGLEAAVYDAEGQLGSLGGSRPGQYRFDAAHRLVSVSSNGFTSEYGYDGAGNRVRAVRNGVTTRYLHDAGGNVVAELDGTGTITRYYIHGLGLLALVEASGPNAGLYVYHADGTGHMVALSDAAGAITHRYSYASFGEVLAEEEAFRPTVDLVGRPSGRRGDGWMSG
jgi:YD repeat-containing protein